MTELVSAAVGVFFGFIAAILKSRVDVAAAVNEQLRERRATEYQALWKHTAILPRWPRRRDVTFAKLRDLQGRLRDWYFQSGGMYLSRRSFEEYSRLQDELTRVATQGASVIPDDVYDAVRARCSALRSSLTDDLLSRRAQSLWSF